MSFRNRNDAARRQRQMQAEAVKNAMLKRACPVTGDKHLPTCDSRCGLDEPKPVTETEPKHD